MTRDPSQPSGTPTDPPRNQDQAPPLRSSELDALKQLQAILADAGALTARLSRTLGRLNRLNR